MHGEPGPGDEGDAEEDGADGVEGAEFVGEEGGNDAEGEAGLGELALMLAVMERVGDCK